MLTLMTYVIVVIVMVPVGIFLSVIAPKVVLTHDNMLLLTAIVSPCVMGWIGWASLHPQPGPRMALFMPRRLHVLIAILLPVLLQIVLLKAETLTFTMGAHGPLTQSPSWPDVNSHWYFYYVIAEQPWLLMILMGCVLPAFCEEIFFRGFVGRGLVARHGIVLGVLLTSALFGVVHFEPWHIVTAFSIGIVLHIVYLCSHSLWTTILLHFVNNVLAFSMMKLQLAGELPESMRISWPLAGGAALGLLGLLGVLWRTRRRWEPGETPAVPRGYFSLERPSDNACLVGLPWRRSDRVVFAACLLLLGGVAYGVGKEGWEWYAAREHVADADAALARQDYAEARAGYDAALRVAPHHITALNGRASAALMLQDYSAALADADRCLHLAPAMAYAMATRAGALSGLGRSKEALVSARRAVELTPSDSWCIGMLVQVALKAGDYPLAINTARQGMHHADDTYCEEMLAWIYLHCEDVAYRNAQLGYDYARRVAQEKDFQDQAALVELAFAAGAIGDFDEAVRWYETAAALDSEADRSTYQQEAEHCESNGKLILELRRVWQTLCVDDVNAYPSCQKLLVVAPQSCLTELQQKPLELRGYEDWTCEVVTSKLRDERLLTLIERLAQVPGLKDQWAEKLAWRIGPTLEDIASSDAEFVAQTLELELAEAQTLLQAIRQHHALQAVNKSQ